MKLRYKILIGAAAGLIVVVAAVLLYIDDLGKTAVETAGEHVMGVSTSVDSMSIGLFSGNVAVAGTEIGNPEGFDTPHFMKIDQTDVAFSFGDLFAETAEVERVTIDAMHVNLEEGKGDDNYEIILANMQKSEDATAGEEGMKFLIREIVITNISVRAEFGVGGEKLSHVDLKIDEIRLENVGSDTDQGMVMSQVMGTIVQATLEAVLKQGYRVLPETMINGLGAGLKGLGKLGANTVKVVGKAGEGAVKVVGEGAKKVGEGVEDVVDGIGGLFGGKKKKKD